MKNYLEKYQLGNKVGTAAGMTKTPFYQNIAKRTAFSEMSRKGLIPFTKVSEMPQFMLDPSKYMPKAKEGEYADYIYDAKTKQFKKNFPRVQTSKQDLDIFKSSRFGSDSIPSGRKVGYGKLQKGGIINTKSEFNISDIINKWKK